jgi:hypothetical protein
MIENPKPDSPKITAKKIWLYTSPILALLLIYVGWVMLARRQENKQLEEKAAQEVRAQERSEAERTVETLGGNEFNILSFYATPGMIRRGESIQLCYGVSNAKTVALDPPVAEMWPSVSRCINLSPAKTTTYTLTAIDAHGAKKNISLEVKVH